MASQYVLPVPTPDAAMSPGHSYQPWVLPTHPGSNAAEDHGACDYGNSMLFVHSVEPSLGLVCEFGIGI